MSAGGAPFTDNVNHPTKAEADASYTEGVGKLVDGASRAGRRATRVRRRRTQPSLFSGGKVPMLFGGQWLAAGFQTDKPKIKYGFAPFPQVDHSRPPCTTRWASAPRSTRRTRTRRTRCSQYLNTKVWNTVLPASPVAPAGVHRRAQDELLRRADQGRADDRGVDTVKADLAAEKTVGVRFTTQWARQVDDLTTAY